MSLIAYQSVNLSVHFYLSENIYAVININLLCKAANTALHSHLSAWNVGSQAIDSWPGSPNSLFFRVIAGTVITVYVQYMYTVHSVIVRVHTKGQE